MNSVHLAEHQGQVRLMGRGKRVWRHRRKGAVHWAAPLCCLEERKWGKKQTWGHETRPYNSAGCLAGGPPVWAISLVKGPPPPLTALPSSGKGRREEGWAVVVCLPIAQSSWVMTQPAASGPAKYISSAGLDHTVSPWRPGTTHLSLWVGPRASSWPQSSVSPESQRLIRAQTKCNCWLNPGRWVHLNGPSGTYGEKTQIFQQ